MGAIVRHTSAIFAALFRSVHLSTRVGNTALAEVSFESLGAFALGQQEKLAVPGRIRIGN